MRRYLISRFIQMLPVAVVVSFLVFSATLLLPGDPAVTILGEQSTQAQRLALRQQMGLDRSIPEQYLRWLGRMLSGDFGASLSTQEPVAQMIRNRTPVTVELSILSVIFGVLVGIPAGVVAAVKRNTWIDVAASLTAMTGLAIPYFWAGILLIMVFSVHLGWLPSSGYVPFFVDPVANLKAMLLPAITLGSGLAALIMRQTRTSMLEVLSADYIRTARAKGAREPRVVLHHGLRNALLPVITVIGLQIGTLLGGAVVTETVFSLSGLGRMIVEGIFQRDFPSIQGAILVIVFSILVVNLLTDLSYFVLDKRISR
ncbi:ABC transporter permease [Bosea sp. BK604]|uniref:ABC transporter permease n=1 Tax=Bosea sp. BK604 TaxID=2512180 RepID=UPI00104E70B3|nr:ABC transporter permease [Bosea sp. BK604]TCR63160.1 peptide/nickel transport system permease protein [Bosea sp. BK604]